MNRGRRRERIFSGDEDFLAFIDLDSPVKSLPFGRINEARKAAACLARKRTFESLSAIGRRLGLRRHSSVASVIRRFEEEMRLDKLKRSRFSKVEEFLMRQAST
jgi:hypothetical protein